MKQSWLNAMAPSAGRARLGATAEWKTAARLPFSLSSRLKAARFESLTQLSPAKQPAGPLKMQRKGFRRAAVQR